MRAAIIPSCRCSPSPRGVAKRASCSKRIRGDKIGQDCEEDVVSDISSRTKAEDCVLGTTSPFPYFFILPAVS